MRKKANNSKLPTLFYLVCGQQVEVVGGIRDDVALARSVKVAGGVPEP